VAEGTVRLKGYTETMRALERIQRGAGKSVLGGMKEAAEPVRRLWIEKLSRYQGVSLGTIGPKVTTRSVFVTQRARKRTGRRSDFGALQMRRGLEALFEREDETRDSVERALDKLTREEGF
jgi:hypothetical protein